jgi:predicted nucleic acid-binding protein
MYLLDTPVISELRKAKTARCDPGVVRWASGVARQNLYMSAISLLELENSVGKAERKDKIQAAPLRAWLDEQVMNAFDGRILAVDSAVVKKRATLESRSERDALVAATAQVHGLVLVTRQTTAFKSARVKIFNPWGYTPEDELNDDNADWQQVAKTGPLWLKNLFLRF